MFARRLKRLRERSKRRFALWMLKTPRRRRIAWRYARREVKRKVRGD